MANRRSSSGFYSLRTLFAQGTTTGMTDGQLLRRFVDDRAMAAGSAEAAEAAFAALVDRHGPMVWGVCRRVLRDPHQAEDAFQAVFLVLVRKAGSVRIDGSLGRWLYGVARRVARRARLDAERREARAVRSGPPPSVDPAIDLERRELGDAVNQEVDRLPLKYRRPIELCYFQGLTYEQAARSLDWPPATVKSRLTRGKLRLRRGLARRGIAPGVLAAAVAEARAAVPPALARSTARAAVWRALDGAAVSYIAASLSEGVIKVMAWEKIAMTAAGAVVAFGLTAAGVAQQAQQPPNPLAAESRPPLKAEAPRPSEPDPRWFRRLENGMTIEVVGVSSHPAGPGAWRRPDGTPMEEAPCDPPHSDVTPNDPKDVVRSILVRVSEIPADSRDKTSIEGSRGGSWEMGARGGKRDARLKLATQIFSRSAKTCAVRFEVAAGPWKTIQEWGDGPGALSRRTMDHGAANINQGAVQRSYVFSNPIPTRAGTVLSVSHDAPENWEVRLVAVDREGKTHPGTTNSSGGFGTIRQLVAEFDLPPDRIKAVHVQGRAFEKFEIPGVRLQPDEAD